MSGTRPAFYWKVWLGLNWSPYPALSTASPLTCRCKSGLVSTEQLQVWSMTWRNGCKIWRMLRKYSQSLFSACVCWMWHFTFSGISGWCLCNFWDLEKVFSFSSDSSTVSFFFLLKETSQDFCCSDHLRPWMSKYVVIFVFFFFLSFFLFFVPASLSGAFAPSAWNSSGHREAAGLSFVSSNHSYWFGVWSNYGSFVLGRGRAGCMEGWPVCGSQGLCSLPTALVTFHSWRKLSLEHWFTENVAFCWVQVDDSSCWSGRARGKCWFS